MQESLGFMLFVVKAWSVVLAIDSTSSAHLDHWPTLGDHSFVSRDHHSHPLNWFLPPS